jgi:hypothetical protein
VDYHEESQSYSKMSSSIISEGSCKIRLIYREEPFLLLKFAASIEKYYGKRGGSMFHVQLAREYAQVPIG